MEKEQLKKLFIDKLGMPDNEDKLNDYLTFCYENHGVNTEIYYEKHHILPRSIFGEYTKEKWNIVCLSYENHVLSHFLLAEAYLKRHFSNTLNFLKNKTEDEVLRLRQIISETSKKWWKDLTKEEYEARCLMCSERMLIKMQPNTNFYKKVCEGINTYYQTHPERKKEIGLFFKKLWKTKTKEEYDEWCKNMQWLEDRRISQKKYMKERYSNDEFKNKFRETMKKVNSNESKRLDASTKIKAKWQEEEFKSKMMERKHGSNSLSLTEKWKDPVWREYMLESRKKSKERKKNET